MSLFMILRLLAAGTGLVTVFLVLGGAMTDRDFIMPDLLAGGWLFIAAMEPRRVWAWRGLVTGNAFALGVFAVALTRQLNEGGAPGAGLVVAVAACVVGMIGLVARPVSP